MSTDIKLSEKEAKALKFFIEQTTYGTPAETKADNVCAAYGMDLINELGFGAQSAGGTLASLSKKGLVSFQYVNRVPDCVYRGKKCFYLTNRGVDMGFAL